VTVIPHDDPDAIARVTEALDAGDLAVVPTDTLYALAADALVEDSVLRVFDVKRRSADKALPICVGGLEDLHHVAFATPLARDLAQKWWPGPVTLVLRARSWLPEAVTAGMETVAVRVPGNAFARELARHFGPFVVTSANRSSEAPTATIEEARAALGADARIYVDAGGLPGTPSTIVDATGDVPKVLREGAVPASEFDGHGR
jgi:L-threonylcarbamoyladenylate synthase